MKIVNDIEIFEPNECYFSVVEDPEENGVVIIEITPISYYKENKCLDDCFRDHSFEPNTLPENFENLMEATWVANGSVNEIKKIMLEKGFVEGNEDFYEC